MALIPIKDDNKLSEIKFQYVTVVFIAACIGVFLWQLTLGSGENRVIYGYGSIPAVLFGTKEMSPGLIVVPEYLTLVTSIFFHGGWMHILFNMLFLWVFGDNVEDSMGHIRYFFFFLITGAIATLAHAIMLPSSEAPLIGASGAVSGILGAYLVLHPTARLRLLFMYIIPLRLPAFVFLIGWIGIQFLSLDASNSDTAWWAHIGGFLAGMLLIGVFRKKNVPLFDGLGRFGADNPNVVDLAQKRAQKSVLPTTPLSPPPPPIDPPRPKGPWDK